LLWFEKLRHVIIKIFPLGELFAGEGAHMPKYKPAKLCKDGKKAFVLIEQKKHYLTGQWGTPEVNAAYAQYCAQWWENYRSPIKIPLTLTQKNEHTDTTVKELALDYLQYQEQRIDSKGFGHCRILIIDFVLAYYGDNTPADSFSPKCLKLIRDALLQSRRFCRNMVNRYTRQIVSMFQWGVENEFVSETTWRALKAVKALRKGEAGTFDNAPRREVSDDVVERTLPFLPPVLRTFVTILLISGMRPSEGYRMTAGDIDRNRDTEFWYYTPQAHKTEEYIGTKTIPFAEPVQALLYPYLTGKKPSEAVFSPIQAMKERNAEKRANRKTKFTPSQTERDKQRAANPTRHTEFYDGDSLRRAVFYAITKANRHLPEGEKIPKWSPYQLRHAAGTDFEKTLGLDKAQAMLGHTTANMTKRYTHGRLEIAKSGARKQVNPFHGE
jgi:integrase